MARWHRTGSKATLEMLLGTSTEASGNGAKGMEGGDQLKMHQHCSFSLACHGRTEKGAKPSLSAGIRNSTARKKQTMDTRLQAKLIRTGS